MNEQPNIYKIIDPKREKDETREHYKERRKEANKFMKQYLKGRPWVPKQRGELHDV